VDFDPPLPFKREEPEEPEDAPRAAARRCLRCGRAFPSAGPQNRLCGPCKAALGSVSPLEPDSLPTVSVVDLAP
jgi:hypothetical protein